MTSQTIKQFAILFYAICLSGFILGVSLAPDFLAKALHK
jgi:hypothetical protein